MRNRATNHLRKAKARQSWSKYNLFNLSRIGNPPTQGRTFFQQKWLAKSMARAYHGEVVREGQWERMFSRRLRAVVPMDARYLASNDGSAESAGRGSGVTLPPKRGRTEESTSRFNPKPTPYMQMTFAPLERRLDTAIFRALFASSTRQARQFVIHGAVTVNGKKMQHPGYLLNPGDMFQVNPERVMYATGAPKDGSLRRSGRARRRMGAKKEGEGEGEAAKSAEAETKEEKREEAKEPVNQKETLKQLLAGAKEIMSKKEVLPAKRRQGIRDFQRSVKRVLSRSTTTTTMTDNLEAQFLALKNMMEEDTKRAAETARKAAANEASKAPAAAPTIPSTESQPIQMQPESSTTDIPTTTTKEVDDLAGQLSQTDLDDFSPADLRALKLALAEIHENPIDSTKPYATPWRPRDYMSPFVFVPRYLEVNHNICAAVYLRHPVARPGLAEVPSPFGDNVGGAAFAWYLRRR